MTGRLPHLKSHELIFYLFRHVNVFKNERDIVYLVKFHYVIISKRTVLKLVIFIFKLTKMTDDVLEFSLPVQSFKNMYMSKEVKYLFKYFR